MVIAKRLEINYRHILAVMEQMWRDGTITFEQLETARHRYQNLKSKEAKE